MSGACLAMSDERSTQALLVAHRGRLVAEAYDPEHGADDLIDYARESVRDRVRVLTGGFGADVVFDPVGGDVFDQAIRAVNWKARMLVVGFAAGRIQAVPANLILVKNISIIGVAWGLEGERDAHRADHHPKQNETANWSVACRQARPGR